MRSVFAVLAAAALACAAPHPQSSRQSGTAYPTVEQQIRDALAKGVKPADIRVCEWEATTGSNIRDWSCRSLEAREVERTTAINALQRMQQTPQTVRGN